MSKNGLVRPRDTRMVTISSDLHVQDSDLRILGACDPSIDEMLSFHITGERVPLVTESIIFLDYSFVM